MARDDAEKARAPAGPRALLLPLPQRLPLHHGPHPHRPLPPSGFAGRAPPGEAQEMISLAQRVESVLRAVYHPLRDELRPSTSARPEARASPAHPHARPAPLGRRHQLHDRHRQTPASCPRTWTPPGHASARPGQSLTARHLGAPSIGALCDGWVVRPGSPCLITVMFCLRARLPSLHKAPFCLRATASE